MNRIIRTILDAVHVLIKKGKKFWLIYLSQQDSAPTEVGKIFSNLIRNRMELYSDKSITTEKNLSKKMHLLYFQIPKF